MEELAYLVKEIRTVESSLGRPEKVLLSVEAPMKRKLGKSVVAVGDLKAGTILTQEMLTVKNAEPCGIPPQDFEKVVGAKLLRDLEDDETVEENDVTMTSEATANGASTKKIVALILARGGKFQTFSNLHLARRIMADKSMYWQI